MSSWKNSNLHANVELCSVDTLRYGKNILSNTVYLIILLSVATLIVFYPVMTAEYSLIDDYDAVASIMNNSCISLKSIFFPAGQEGGYYRPLLHLSQYLDKLLWGMNPIITHVENILLHIWNVIWLYFLVQKKLPSAPKKLSPSFLAAFIFAVHPLVTESVCWYSGRTDLLATAFVLPALYLIIVFNNEDKFSFKIFIALCLLMLAGVMSKESSLAVLIATPLVYNHSRQSKDVPNGLPSFPQLYYYLLGASIVISLLIALFFFKFVPAALFMLLCLLIGCNFKINMLVSGTQQLTHGVFNFFVLLLTVLVLFWGLRAVVFSSSTSRISQTINLMLQDIDYTVGMFMGAVGFYTKKFFLPLPLNFTIREIDPTYQLLGICVLFCVVLIIQIAATWSRFALIGLVLLAPSLPFVFGTIAWTSYAERYAYLSTAFWAAAAALWLYSFRYRVWLRYGVASVIVIFAIISFHRAYIWQTNLRLLSDTVIKTPNFRDVRAFYMLALYQNGLLKEAEAQYHAAMAIPSILYNPLFDTLYARLLYQQGRKAEALTVLDSVDIKTKGTLKEVAELRFAFK